MSAKLFYRTLLLLTLTLIQHCIATAQLVPSLVWAKDIGGNSYERGTNITTDANGNVYSIGVFEETVDFDPGPGVYNLTSTVPNKEGGYITKWDASGNFIWAKQFSGSDHAIPLSVTVDATGNIYISGAFYGTVDFDPGPAVNNHTAAGATTGGWNDIFIVKLDPSGNLVWVNTMGNWNVDEAATIKIDHNNDIVITGMFGLTVDFDPGPGVFNMTATGDEIFIAKYSSTGNFIWAKQFAGGGYDAGISIDIDNSNNIYSIGYFEGTADFDPGPGTYNLNGGGCYVSKLDANGNFIFAKQFGQTTATVNSAYGWSIALDQAGEIYISGTIFGTNDMDPGPAVLNYTSIDADLFVACLDNVGNLVWVDHMRSTSGTSSGLIDVNNLELNAAGDIYIVGGYRHNTDFDPGPSTANLSYSLNDGYVLKLYNNGSFAWVRRISETGSAENQICRGIAIDNSGNIYFSGTFYGGLPNQGRIDFDPCTAKSYLVPVLNADAFVVKWNEVIQLNASVTISSSANTICAGSNLIFNAISVNGGTTPVYQWKLNNVNVGTNSPTYSNNTLVNGDVITVTMTSSINCVAPSPVASNSITITVAASVPAAVSIVSTTTTICSGTAVTFTAVPGNEGSSPTYQWQVNGTNAGTNSPVFTSSTLNNGDVVTCTLTSSSACASPATVSSNNITMIVAATLAPSVSISSSANNICTGTSVIFTATPVNGGTTPGYQWQVNGSNVGTNSPTFTNSTLANGDIVSCVLTSNNSCTFPLTVNSNNITMIVAATLAPSIGISSSANNICTGTSVTFTAMPLNGGMTPVYQWQVNGSNVGTNSLTFTISTLANGDIISCILTSNNACASPATVSSNNITMIVAATLAPSISISSSANNICMGTSVSFTATPVNGGTAPVYQWQVNGSNIGTNSPTFTSSALNNGDIVSCMLTSNNSCTSPLTVTSNNITMIVAATLAPSISISSSANNICTGTSVIFTATPLNGGMTPVYQWQVNGSNVGTNSPTLTISTLANGDIISCILTSNNACASPAIVSSNNITMIVAATLAPSISISSSANNICMGTSVSFTATPVNGGTAPVYQWQINGSNIGTNSPTFTSSALNNGDIVSCVLTSNNSCTSPLTVTSNNITMIVAATLTPSISISSSANNICTGTSVIFTAMPLNGGMTPVYQWQVNGSNVGTNSLTFTISTLANGDIISCILTSNNACASPATVSSNNITMIVAATLAPSISISSSANNICTGTSVIFTAMPLNGGMTPVYQWQVNGSNVGTNSPTFTNSTLANGDIVSCMLTSNNSCTSPLTVTSNNITMIVAATLAPSVSISSSANNICTGTSVIFTATPVNGGTTPGYQWQVNGSNVGTNSPTFTNSTLANGDIVSCVLTSNNSCTFPLTVNSNNITMIVAATLAPSISISSSANNICTGTAVTFTATPMNGGTTPVYQWQVNGSNVGTNSSTFTSSTLANGNIVSCVLTSNHACTSPSTANSNGIIMIINSPVLASVTINVFPAAICPNETFTFNANAVNAGSNALYQWHVNGLPAGSNSPEYASANLSNGDLVSCILTPTNSGCPPGSVTSNTIAATVYSLPSLNISPADTIVSPGSMVHLSAIVGGSISSFEWQPAGSLNNSSSLSVVTMPLQLSQDYFLRIKTAEGCSVTDKATIHVFGKLLMPNAFTPNGDGLNDLFRIPPNVRFTLENFSIYDRWGNLLFNTNDISRGWDGTVQGTKSEQGNYLYIIKGTENKNAAVFKGSFLLIR